MIRRPPRSTRTDTRFPYTTLFRSPGAKSRSEIMADVQSGGGHANYRTVQGGNLRVTMEAGRIVVTDPNGRSSRSEEHTSELQSLMRISYAVFCLKKKKHKPDREYNYRRSRHHCHTY